MKLKDYFKSDIKIKVSDNVVFNEEEKKNNEGAFSQYLEQEDYFEKPKMKNFKKQLEPILEKVGNYLKGDILELGAGNCTTSAIISKKDDVNSLTCVEISKTMISEIAPRVVSHDGGNIEKFRFIAGDMHDISLFNDKKYDAIVLFRALHHVLLPYNQIEKWYNLLKENGVIICLQEPALPNICLPTKSIKDWTNKQIYSQRIGNNENYWKEKYYKELFTKFNLFSFEYIENSIKERVKRVCWKSRIFLSFIAKKQ